MSHRNGNDSSVLDRWTTTLAKAERQAGRREALQEVSDLFSQAERARLHDLRLAQHASVDIYVRLRSDLDIECLRVYLRSRQDRSFEALFFVGADDFRTERFEEAYDLGWAQTERLAKEGIEYEASFAPLHGQINKPALSEDGYFTSYPYDEDQQHVEE